MNRKMSKTKRRTMARRLQAQKVRARSEPTVAELLAKLSTREEQHRDITSATMQLRADSINERERSIDAALVTENPVTVYDWERGEFIDEVLLVRGMRPVEQVPLLDNHSRWSLDDVFGSCRNIRVAGNEIAVRLFFADMSSHEDDPEAKRVERAWTKVQQRHQREVSAGYRVFQSERIPAGQTVEFRGRTYKAGVRPMRIGWDWVLREGSLTPVAADPAAGTRNEEIHVNKFLLFLISTGLRKDATLPEAWEYAAKLTDTSQRTAVREIIDDPQNGLTVPQQMRTAMEGWSVPTPPVASTNTPTVPAVVEGATRSVAVVTPAPVSPAVPDVAATVREQLARERDRTRAITTMFSDNSIDNPALQERAIGEGWEPARVAQEILPLVRSRASQPIDNSGHVGIHSRQAPTVQAMGLAMLLSHSNVRLDSPVFQSDAARRLAPDLLRLDINNPERQRAMEQAHQFSSRGYSLVELCRQTLAISTGRIPENKEDMIRAALSSGALQDIFSTNINARLLASFVDAVDTTMEWTRTDDVDDFKQFEGHTMGKFGALTVHAPGKTADDLDVGSSKYTGRMFRYSGKWSVDEMDIIDDRLGGINQISPEDMGNSARQIRPNLCYSRLLANPTFLGTAVFHATRNNLFSGAGDAMSIAALEAAVVAFGKQRIRTRPLNLFLRYIMGPHDLVFKAETILSSAERRNTTATTDYGVNNPVANRGIKYIPDDRLGVAGCIDPETGTSYAGTATNYFCAGTPGQNGAKTLRVVNRRGTNRAPVVRSYALDRGQWGIGWDINYDIGCCYEDFIALQKHAGA